ncbi:MAG: S1 family peptidase [Sandaracinaceae bacterium]|nr:S1 family peptidase [Sandaracinaceae bacterium]
MRRLLPLALLLAACEPPMPAAVQAPIVDGTFEPGEEAVVLVTSFGVAGLCTGTLIAPNVVLTAKHCVQAPGMEAPYPVTAFTVGIGSRQGETRDYRAQYVDTTPGAYYQSDVVGLTGEIFGIDVGLLILRGSVDDVTPIPIRRDRPDDLIGQSFTAIGFGQRPGGMAAGDKYKGDGILQAVTDTGILFTEQVICSGDSGGPMIQETPERRVIGVASFGEAGACPSSRDGYNAVWNNLDYIDRALVLGGNCLGLEETCNSLDDDCDGNVDEGCAELGAACGDSSECAHAQLPAFLPGLAHPVECVDLGAGSICTRSCDPTRPSAGCASLEGLAGATVPVAGRYCQRDGCEGWCVPGEVGSASDGAGCAADTECESLFCANPGDGLQRCLLPCRAGLGECPLGEVCVGSAEGCGGCVDGSIVSGGRGLGEPCASDAECGGVCVEGACAVACSAAAPCVEGFTCRDELCVRGTPAGLGDPCGPAGECAAALTCEASGDRRWCSQPCVDASECDDGMICEDRSGEQICAPEGAILGEDCDGTCVGGVCEGGRCTRACGAGELCPIGFDCRRDDSGRARCLRIASVGGCAAGGENSPSVPSSLAFLLLCAYLRRRT